MGGRVGEITLDFKFDINSAQGSPKIQVLSPKIQVLGPKIQVFYISFSDRPWGVV